MAVPNDPYLPILQALKSGLVDAAATLASQLARRQPGDARAHALQARVLAAQGDPAAARAAAERALRLDPKLVPAHIELASLARAATDWPRAQHHLEQVVRFAPTFAEGWLDLGHALLAQQRDEEAARAFAETVRLQPARHEAWLQLGARAIAHGAHEEALQHFGQVIERAPHVIEGWLHVGETFLLLDRPKGAVGAFERATTQAPDNPHAWDGLVRSLRAIKASHDELIAARRGLALAAKTAEAWTLVAMQCVRAGRLADARAAYESALAIDADHLPARWGRFQYPVSEVFDDAALATFLADWRDGVSQFAARWPDAPSPGLASSCVTLATNFYLHYLGEPFVDEQREYGALLGRMMQVFAPAAEAPVASRPRDGRRRVGILSAFLRRHTMTKLFASVITGLDRDAFEISVLQPDNTKSDYTDALVAHADFYASGENSLAWWVETIRARELDVLLYIDIGMHPIAQGLAALRLAPVQATLWGHPVTTGLPTIDWFLTSDAMEAPDGERNYTERVLRLPNLGTCYAVPTESPAPAPIIDAEPDRVHYFFGQSAFKIMPVHDEMLARLALALPAARVHMTPHPNVHTRTQLRERMSRHFAARGVDFDTLVGTFRYVTEPEFMGLASRSAVNLDSLGWSGGNTTLEILWHDVPTVTLPGKLMRSRHTYAMLKLLGLDALIARDLDDYLRIAVALGRSPDFRAEMSGLIRERKHRLYDDRSVIAAINAFLRDPDAAATALPSPRRD